MQHKKAENIELLLSAIEEISRETRRSPTNAELVRATGLGAGTVSRYLNYMSEQGLIDFEPRHRLAVRRENSDDNTEPVAIVGRIACGLPMDAKENIEGYIRLPSVLLGSGTYFLLRTYGDSMTEAGIDAGDLVLIRQQEYAENGQIVVAMTDDGETTLKRFYRDDEHRRVILHPENSSMEDIVLESCVIQGIACKIIKNVK